MIGAQAAGPLLALLQAVAVPAMQQAPQLAAPPHQSRWHWTGTAGDPRKLVVKLVRGSYRIVRDDGPARVDMEVTAGTGDPGAVRFNVETGSSVVISDAYPANRFPSWRECLPPQDSRGDFWDSDAVVDATIHAPRTVPVSVEIMDERGAQD